MKKTLLLVMALGFGLAAHGNLYWTSAPGSAESGQSYYIAAQGSGPESNEMWLYKNGAFVAYSSGWYSVSLGYSATDYGAQTVHWHADAAYMWYAGGEYMEWWEGIDHWITINQSNNAPTITWTQAPSSYPINQWFNLEARGNDADGNLSNVFVWREWVPHAFNGGGNGFENYSGNPSYGSAVGTVTFMAQAKDSADAYSPVIYHTVTIYVPNVAPTATWVVNPATAWVNQWFTIQSRGNDGNGNLAWIYVWKDGAPFAFNGGGNGWEAYSDNNGTSKSTTGSFHFQTQAGDADGAQSALHSHYVTIDNRTPHSPTLSASGTGVIWNATGQHYEMWIEEAGNPAKPGTITLTGNVKDYDGNLNLHHIWKGPGGTLDWANPITSLTPSNAADSTAVHSNFKPTFTGRWDFHTNAQDNAGAWSGGASVTVWVYGPTNNSEVISFKVNGVSYAPNTASIPLGLNNNASASVEVVMRNSGAGASKPWAIDATPHGLGVVGDDNRWGPIRHALPSSPVNPFPAPGQTSTFTFNLTAPAQPLVNQTVRWQMVEDGIQWLGAQTPPLVVTVLDTLAPNVPSNLVASNITHDSFRLDWTPPSDNGGVTAYEVERQGAGVVTVTGPTHTYNGLAPYTAYQVRVRARDAAGNWSSWTAYSAVTTANRAPTVVSATGGTIAYGQFFDTILRATDADSDLAYFHLVVANATFATNNWEGSSPDGWKWRHFRTNAVSGGDATITVPVQDFNYGTPNPLPVGTYRLTLNAQDRLPNYAYSASNVLATLIVAPATPSGAFVGRTLTASGSGYTIQAGDLNAAFANPYSAAVAAPTGTVTYLIVGPGTAVTAGTVLAAGQAYTIRASYPGDANYNATTSDATFTIADAAAPAVPAGLSASAISSTSFTLSWTASTDNVGVTAYEVFRNGVSLGTTASTSMANSGLAANTAYAMTVRARDAADNWSAQSTALAVTTTADPNADTDGDGVPNNIETQLGTNPSVAKQTDTANAAALKITKPN